MPLDRVYHHQDRLPPLAGKTGMRSDRHPQSHHLDRPPRIHPL